MDVDSKDAAEWSTLMSRASKLEHALRMAKEKLILYRAAHGGEYLGGMEYSQLAILINEALS